MTGAMWTRAGLLTLLLTVGAVLALAVDLPDVHVLRSWLADTGGAGWAAVALGVAAVLLAPIPRSAVSALVGLLAGFWTGLAVAFVGGLLAALAAFGLSRALGRAAVERFAGRRTVQVDRLLADRGFLTVLSGRLLPVMPFVVLSYGAGLTSIRPATYACATALGLVPSTVVQVGVGASAGAIVAGAAATTTVVLLVCLLAAAAAALAWRRRTRRVPGPTEPEVAAG